MGTPAIDWQFGSPRAPCARSRYPVSGCRHSYATHLLRQGVRLKVIGDLLGHRSTESTCVYLRLDLEELREVALPLPGLAIQETMS